MHNFAFIDETGITKQERFFGIGLLMVESTDSLYRMIKNISHLIRQSAVEQKKQRIEFLQKNRKVSELSSLAKADKNFELKHKAIGLTNQLIYCELIKRYFNEKKARFTAVVVDKRNPEFKPKKLFPGTWDAYITYGSMVLAREASNIKPQSITLLADEITKPSSVDNTLEQEIAGKFQQFCTRRRLKKKIKLHSTMLESNAHLLIQLTDVLLGSVVYDFKRRSKVVSRGLRKRKQVVTDEIIRNLKRKNISESFTITKPNYFSVWEMKWK